MDLTNGFLHALKLKQEEIKNSMVNGNFVNFESYQRYVGIYQGLQEALDILDNLMKYLGVDKPTSPFIHNDLILFNNNTFNFMNTWADACISSNHITIWDEYVYNVILWKFNIKEDHFIQPIDVYFENFYSNAETRHTTYIYHGCKDPNTVQYLFNEMNKYYEHPLTVFEAKPFTKIRIGRDNDGGYVVADLHSYDLFFIF